MKSAWNDERPAAARSAFTLVELLVVIAVIAVLLGLSAPGLLGARQSAGAAVALSNLRGIGVVVELYTTRYDGVYPYHGADTSVWFLVSPPPEPPVLLAHVGNVWALSSLWPAKMHEVAPWREHFRSWLNVGYESPEGTSWGGWSNVSYSYSCSFFASPDTWSAGEPGPAEELIEPIRNVSVSYPSSKVLMFDKDRAYLGAANRALFKRGVLMADGSASGRLDSEATAPVQNRIDTYPPRIYSDTPLGVRGRDFR